MRKIIRISTAVAVILAILVIKYPSMAITNPQPDGEGHPFVGQFLTDVDHDGQPDFFPICSGTLLSPTVFLTAGHCLRVSRENGWTEFWVSFDSVYTSGISPAIKVVAAVMNPDYNPKNSSNDVSLMILEAPVTDRGFGQIPPENLLDQMQDAWALEDMRFTTVGYGATVDETGKPIRNYDGVRRWSTSPFQALNQNNLILLDNHNVTEQVGECSGDSGGPLFFINTNVIAAIDSWGDGACRAMSGAQRVDLPSVRSFIADYINLP